jgi:acyl dehydratase
MPMDLSWVGREVGPYEIAWTPELCMIYALGVGAGADALEFTTENTVGVPQQVLPTLVSTLGGSDEAKIDVDSFGSYSPHQVVHAGQKIELGRPLAPRDRVLATLRVAGIWDKRAGALVEVVTTGLSPDSGELVFRNTTALLVLGEGGFGGPRGPTLGGPRAPQRPADFTVQNATHSAQALWFRLAGDRNRIHTDPAAARQAGFERPILHGLCTFGFAGRALLGAVCGGDPARFRSMEGRFARPALPGDTLITEIWLGPDVAYFQTRNGRGESLLERGVFGFDKAAD